MAGITDLERLIREMKPVLAEGTFVYCTVAMTEAEEWLARRPVATFIEAEGLSLILTESEARTGGLATSAPMRMITLSVHSSLEAVGLTAAVSSALAAEGISANMVAAFHHDHLLVPAGDAQRALAILERLTGNGSRPAD